ncbi:phage tail tip fiber protein [Paenirhodobacter populi]|uniref:Tip attachment protein J central straight fiber domain-containing protein n=1 Tax=Paenirhodobacter populi TaxID=2306993 RepID=A0A443J1F4_9RHOB|nr:hypothetical protein [Sinirhodobacter populi]RWR14260.1 hypothetical protein D2T33_03325 [Sinirhodobacter populi]
MSKAASFIVAAVGFVAAPYLAGLGGAILGVGAGTIASKLALTVSLSALSRALTTQAKAGGAAGIKTSTTLTGETNPEAITLGWTATAGQAICPPMSHGKNNRYMTHVVELCSAPGATLNRVMINNTYVTLGAEEYYGRRVITGDQAHLIWVRYYDGRQTAADPMLLDKYRSHPDRPWLPDMIGNGICYAVLTFLFDDKRLTSIPKYLFELTGIPLYDPRQDSTVGGDGPQRWSDPATWTQTVNNAVIAYNIMRGIRLPGGDVWGGRIESADVPLSVWVAAMNICDQPPSGSTEPQYRCGIEAYLKDEPAGVLEEILKGCSGDVADIAGTWKIRVGGPSLPVMTIADGRGDILISKEQSLDPFPTLDSTYNGITATFPNPAGLWQTKEAPARYNADWEAADRFGRKVADVQFNAVPYEDQVQRLMLPWIEAERHFRTHKLTLTPAAAALEPLDTIAWASARNGYTLKQFEITETVDDLMTCCQGEALKEVDPSDYGWSPTFLLPSTPSSPGYTLPAPEELLGWGFAADVIKDAAGVARRPALRLSWDGELLADGVEWETRLAGEISVRAGSTQTVSAGSYQISDGVLGGTTYQGRGRLIIAGTETAWSDWITATTDDISLTLADLTEDLRDWLSTMQEWIEGGSGDMPQILTDLADQIASEQADRVADAMLAAERWRETRETVRALQAQAVELASANHAAREEIRRSIAVELGTLRASYDEQIVTLADAGLAAALKIETLEATSADQGARIQQVAQAQIEGDEALAQLITGLAVGNATQFDQAEIWYFDSSAEGWTGSPSDPVATDGGFIRPANGTDTYIVSPSGLAIAAGTYSQLRARLQRTGDPAWTGWLWWAAAGEAWDTARRVAIPEPIWSGNEGLVTIQPGWIGTIDRVRLDLVDNTASDAAEIDWIAIGRPAPGASSADLSALQQAMTTADQALAQTAQQLQADLNATQGTAAGAASAVNGLSARVTATEGALNSQSESITALQNRVEDPATGNAALADAVDQIRSETQTGDGSQVAQSEAIRVLRSHIRALTAEGVETAAQGHAGAQALRDYIAEASQSLNTRIDLTDDQVDIIAEAVTALQAAIPGLATAAALQALHTTVSQQGSSISANSSWLTSLQAGLDALTGVVNGKASASALSGLTARVTDAEGVLASQSANITSLSNSLNTTNGNVSAAQQAAQQAATLAGSKGKVIVQSTAPAAADRLAQNLWIDTTSNANTPKRWNGTTWVAVTDKVATDAAAAAASALQQVATKASATALQTLQTTVTQQGAKITAQGDAQTALQALVGMFQASGLFRVTVEATPAGALARIGLKVAASGSESSSARTAALFLEAIAGGLSRVVVQADRFALTDGAGRFFPFVVANGRVWIDSAYIREASIQTLMLAGNAVTVPVSAAGVRLLGGGGLRSLVNITMDLPAGTPALIFWSIEQSYSALRAWDLQIKRNNWIMKERLNMNYGTDWPSGQVMDWDTSGGWRTYSLMWNAANQQVSAIGSLVILGVKR